MQGIPYFSNHYTGAAYFMKRAKALVAVALMVIGFQTMILAEKDTVYVKDTTKPLIQVEGFGYIMFGELVAGDYYPDGPLNNGGHAVSHYGQNNGFAHIGVISNPTPWFTAKTALEMSTFLTLQYGSMDKSSYYEVYNADIPSAEGIFHWSNLGPTVSSFLLESGLFQYTNNAETKDLGNYLYRTQAYPAYIETQLDYPVANLEGARAQVGFFNDKLRIEALANCDYIYLPWHDWNFGFTATYNPSDVLSLMYGICFDHALDMNGNAQAFPDSLDKLYQATKEDATLIFDPKPLVGGLKNICGSEDFKIYGEAAVLGQKSYQYYPNDLSIPRPYYWCGLPLQNMPMMAGFNIPSFSKLLSGYTWDVLSVEVEWWKYPYPNDWLGYAATNGTFNAEPMDYQGDMSGYGYPNQVKWSVYLDKSIQKFEIKLMAMNDHDIYKTFSPQDQNCSEQFMRTHGDWQWYVELRYNL